MHVKLPFRISVLHQRQDQAKVPSRQPSLQDISAANRRHFARFVRFLIDPPFGDEAFQPRFRGATEISETQRAGTLACAATDSGL
jgi:hypothetical protein